MLVVVSPYTIIRDCECRWKPRAFCHVSRVLDAASSRVSRFSRATMKTNVVNVTRFLRRVPHVCVRVTFFLARLSEKLPGNHGWPRWMRGYRGRHNDLVKGCSTTNKTVCHTCTCTYVYIHTQTQTRARVSFRSIEKGDGRNLTWHCGKTNVVFPDEKY